jgi:hypothetical protein
MSITPYRLARVARPLGALLGAAVLAACAADLPQAPPSAAAVPPPDPYAIAPGTPIDGTARIALRGSRGAGVLEANGQRQRFTIAGLSAAGAPRALVRAEVYGLQRIADLPGTFRDVGGAASDLGGALRLGNDRLVVMVLRPSRPGPVLSVPPGGATVNLVR